jgi:hypothetical protein
MNLFLTAGALALGAALVGCGDTSPRPHVDPDIAGKKPTWDGCQLRSVQAIDYVADAPGAKSRAAALARYRVDGDHVVDRPPRAHRNARVLLVDEDDVIHHALELRHAEHGWLVSMVEACAD